MPNRIGRPSKFTAERQERILDAIRAGNYIEPAARAAGIGKSTFYEWVERYPDFSDAVKSAQAEAEIGRVAIVKQAGEEHWQAAAWWLERSSPQRWSRSASAREEPWEEALRAKEAEDARPVRTEGRFKDLIKVGFEIGFVQETLAEIGMRVVPVEGEDGEPEPHAPPGNEPLAA